MESVNYQRICYNEALTTTNIEDIIEKPSAIGKSMRRSAIFCEEFLNTLEENSEINKELININVSHHGDLADAQEDQKSMDKPKLRKKRREPRYKTPGFTRGQPCNTKTSNFLQSMIKHRSQSKSPTAPITPTTPHLADPPCFHTSHNLSEQQQMSFCNERYVNYNCHSSYNQSWQNSNENKQYFPETNDYNCNPFYRRNQIPPNYDQTFSY